MTAARRYFALRNVLLLGCSTVSVFSPSDLFASGEQGIWYDPSDLSTMFQNAIGTTPVTAVDQPVGLIFDKSKGLAVGAELVPAPYVGTGSGTWAVGATSVTRNGSSTGQVSFILSDSISTTKSYRVSFTVSDLSGDTLYIRLSNGPVNQVTANGAYSAILIPGGTGGTMTFAPWGGSAGQVTITNVTVRELVGNHALQSTSGSEPVFKATSNVDFDGTDDKWTGNVAGGGTTGFLFVAGIKIDATGSNQTIWSDTGTNTGYRVRINSSNQVELAAGNGSSFTTAVTTETLSAGTNYVIAAWHDGANLNVKLGSGGAVASQAFATATAGMTTFTVGMDNGAVSSQLNGRVFNAVCVKNFAGSVAAVNSTISYVNGKLA